LNSAGPVALAGAVDAAALLLLPAPGRDRRSARLRMVPTRRWLGVVQVEAEADSSQPF